MNELQIGDAVTFKGESGYIVDIVINEAFVQFDGWENWIPLEELDAESGDGARG